MTCNADLIKRVFFENEVEITENQAEKFARYAFMLTEKNKEVNLTAITEPSEIAVKHFLDSALLIKAVKIESGMTVADIGTGAGFPGIPTAILNPEIKLILIDSLNKRLEFVKSVCEELNIDAQIIHKRAEECGREPLLRDNTDIVTARAVANLSSLAEYCLPLVKKGGIFAAMKGPGADEEAKEAKNALALLSGEIEEIKSFLLPPDQTRNIIIVRKIGLTDPKYPRRSTKISKNPL